MICTNQFDSTQPSQPSKPKTPSIQSSLLGLGVLQPRSLWDGVALEAWALSPLEVDPVPTRMPLPEGLLVEKILQQERIRQKRPGKTIWECFADLHPMIQSQIQELLDARNDVGAPWTIVFLEVHNRRLLTFYHRNVVFSIHIILARRADSIPSGDIGPVGHPPNGPIMRRQPGPPQIEHEQPVRGYDDSFYTAQPSAGHEPGYVPIQGPHSDGFLAPHRHHRPQGLQGPPPLPYGPALGGAMEEERRKARVELERHKAKVELERQQAADRVEAMLRRVRRRHERQEATDRRKTRRAGAPGRAGRRFRRESVPDTSGTSSDRSVIRRLERRSDKQPHPQRSNSRHVSVQDSSESDKDHGRRIKKPFAARLRNSLSIRNWFPRWKAPKRRETIEEEESARDSTSDYFSDESDASELAVGSGDSGSDRLRRGAPLASGRRRWLRSRSRQRASKRSSSKEREEARQRLRLDRLDRINGLYQPGTNPAMGGINSHHSREFSPGRIPPRPRPMHPMPPPTNGMPPIQYYQPGIPSRWPPPPPPPPQFSAMPSQPPSSALYPMMNYHPHGPAPYAQPLPAMPVLHESKNYHMPSRLKEPLSRTSSWTSWKETTQPKKKKSKKKSEPQESDQAVVQRYMKFTSAPEAPERTVAKEGAGNDDALAGVDNATTTATTTVESTTTAPPPASAPSSEPINHPGSTAIVTNGVAGHDLESPHRLSMAREEHQGI